MEKDLSLKHISFNDPAMIVKWNDEHEATNMLFRHGRSVFHLSILWECCPHENICCAALRRIEKLIAEVSCLEKLCTLMQEIHSGSYRALRQLRVHIGRKMYELGNTGHTCSPRSYRLAIPALNDLVLNGYMYSLVERAP